MFRRLQKTVLFLMLIAGILTACSSELSEATEPLEDEMVEEGQIIVLEKPEKPVEGNLENVEEGKKYQIQTRLTDFHLFNNTSGIAWGATRGELRIYLTQNQGKTWTSISPSASVLFADYPKYRKDIFFTDAKHGWVVRNPVGASDAIVLRTQDGGETWKIATLPGSKQAAAIYFANSMKGWILAVNGSNPEALDKTLYQTDDGGATWVQIMTTSANSSELVIPKAGTVTSMYFIDGMNGYVSMMVAGEPKLFVTDNGGISWEENSSFFTSDKYKSCTTFVAGELNFFKLEPQPDMDTDIKEDTPRKKGWVPIGCVKDNAVKFNGYYTEDAGDNWKLTTFATFWQKGVNEAVSPVFVSSEEGWILHHSKVFYTEDQGQSWTVLPPNRVLNDIMADYPHILKLQFVSSNVGWLLVGQSDQKRSLLLQTLDGGKTWRVL